MYYSLYRRWSPELESVMDDLKKNASEEISGYFDDVGTNIIKV